MSKRNRAKKRQRRKLVCQKCGYRGAIKCYLPDTDRVHYRRLTTHGKPTGGGRIFMIYEKENAPDEVLCGEHASEAGYCRSCGDFWAGIKSFDFVHPGLCDNCHDQNVADQDYSDWDSEEDYGGHPFD